MIYSGAASTVPAGTWLRVEFLANVGTGAFAAAIYSGDSTTPLDSYTVASGFNFGSGATTITATRFGVNGNTTSDLYIDDVKQDDFATAFIGPAVTLPPTASITPAYQNVVAGAAVSATVSANDPDGSIASYAWTVVGASSTTTPSLTGASTDTVSLTAPAAGNLVTLQCVVTDNEGATVTVTTEIRVTVTGTFTTLALDVGTNVAWTLIGAAGTKGAALADALDSTGSQSPAYAGTQTEERHRLQPLVPRSTLTLTTRTSVTTTGGTTKVRLYEGNTLRQEWELDQSTSAADQDCVVTSPAEIVDWGNLWVATSAVS